MAGGAGGPAPARGRLVCRPHGHAASCARCSTTTGKLLCAQATK